MPGHTNSCVHQKNLLPQVLCASKPHKNHTKPHQNHTKTTQFVCNVCASCVQMHTRTLQAIRAALWTKPMPTMQVTTIRTDGQASPPLQCQWQHHAL